MLDNTSRWRGRPVASAVLRLLVHLGPLAIAIGASAIVAEQLPPPATLVEAAVKWLLLSAIATLVLLSTERLARRALPLSALLKLSLAFPEAAPSRFRVARQVGSVRDLEREVLAADPADGRTMAAERLLRLVGALAIHDRATRGHADRVRVFSDMIAEELGLDQAARDRLRWAALVHDVGKIAVHPDILNKPGPPSDAEWALLQQHPVEGARLAGPLLTWLGEWGLTIEQHHEKWDGTGYPRGLAGSEICRGARIVAVADAYDVMTSRRPYRAPVSASEARAELARCSGSQFDPTVVRAFLTISIGRLRLASGPLSWLAQLPFVRPLPHVPALPQAVWGGAAAVLGGIPGLVGLAPEVTPDPPPTAVVITEETTGRAATRQDFGPSPSTPPTERISPPSTHAPTPLPTAEDSAPVPATAVDEQPHVDSAPAPDPAPSGGRPTSEGPIPRPAATVDTDADDGVRISTTPSPERKVPGPAEDGGDAPQGGPSIEVSVEPRR